MTSITVAIDKLDKIGIEKVKEELIARGLNNDQVELVETFISIEGNNEEKLEKLDAMFNSDEIGKQGIAELRHILDTIQQTTLNQQLIIDLSLARGLNYYTGSIFEVKATGVQMGSIGGGGRYDDLTGLFGVKGIAGVGISFGVDRIYDVMDELNIFPDSIQKGTTVLFFNTGAEEQKHILVMAQELRAKGISTEIFHESTKFDKQFKYAERKNIPYVVIVGSKEIEAGTCMVKNLTSSTQLEIKASELVQRLMGGDPSL